VPRISSPPLSPEERKRAAARRFGSSVAPAARSSRPPEERPSDAGGTSVSQKLAVESIRKAYEAKVLGGSQSRVARYVTQADEADAAGDPLAAANALRLAASLAPDDEDLAARLRATELAAAIKLAPKYIEQAGYQEGRGEFAEAAASFEKALRARAEDAALHARVARCYLQDGKSLKRAAELARRAVELAPDTASYRIGLGRIYARAGMIQSALAELERAKTLAPGDDSINQLIKQIRRGDE
jgi:tetratricopeptide (TPR) repeat protein